MPSLILNGNKIGGTVDDATLIRYNNEESTLSSNKIQDAITELDSKVNENLTEAKEYAETVGQEMKDSLLNGAGAAYDTLKELGELIDENKDALDAVNELANKKQDVATAINASNIGNQNVNYANSAGEATKLATARNIQTNLGSTSAASFNGTAAITPGVTGTLGIGNGGTGATTTAGIHQNITGSHWTTPAYIDCMGPNGHTGGGGYCTIAELKTTMGLNNVNNTADSAKSVKYATSAGSANAVAWGNVSGKPSTFTPASHTHSYLGLGGGTLTGALTVPKLISSGTIGFSSAYSTNTSFYCVWKDGNNHDLVARGNNGLNVGVGWAGSSSYSTQLNLRGRTVQVTNASGTSTLSDERLKKDFTSLEMYDKFFDSIEPCAFRMKSGSSGRYHIGYKAQQIENALTENGLSSKDFAGFIRKQYLVDKDDEEGSAVYAEAGIKNGDNEYGLIYTEFTGLHTYQIQQAKKRIAYLENENLTLKNKLDDIEKRISSIGL